MSVLSDTTIRDHSHLGEGGLIWPWNDDQLQPASYDLTLSGQDDMYLKGQGMRRIEAGEFLLLSTVEKVCLPSHIVGRIEGKSSWARKGLIIHTAGFVDPGFCGTLVLEITNLSKEAVKLVPGIRIAQISFMFLDKPAQKPYGHKDLKSHYQNQEGIVQSWIK